MATGVFNPNRDEVKGTWKQGPVRLQYSHEALIDAIIANPTATNAQLGQLFGRTAQWVSIVKNSDLFREKLYERRAQISDPLLEASLDERFNILAKRSLEVLINKMARPEAEISDELALEAVKLGAKAKSIGGFGNRIQVETHAPDVDRIERLAERLSALNGGTKPQGVSDVPFVEQVAAAGGSVRSDALPADHAAAPAVGRNDAPEDPSTSLSARG